jgi:hypothetical protein
MMDNAIGLRQRFYHLNSSPFHKRPFVVLFKLLGDFSREDFPIGLSV